MRTLRRSQTGFTLVEILVVVLIIGIIASSAILSVSLAGNDREMRSEAQRLISLLELARDEALMQGRELGVEFVAAGYRFVEYDPFAQRWAEVPGDDLLRERALPDGYRLDLYLDDLRVSLDTEPRRIADPDDDDERRTDDVYTPHLFIDSGGSMTPFAVELRRETDDLRFRFSANGAGTIEIDDADDGP